MKVCKLGLAMVAAVAPLQGVAASVQEDFHLKEAKAIFDWVSGTQDGHITSKLELRRENPGDLSSPMGVYATETIQIGEEIVRVPWSVIIKPEDNREPPSQLVCGTVRNVAKEMRLGADSKYAPYVMYLNSEADAQIPSTWSRPGRELLLDVLDHDTIPPGNPVSWIQGEWFGRCRGDPEDEFGIKAALMVIQRADDQIMIPAYDNLNHRNGNWTNTITEIERGEYHITSATKMIEAGEQIYISYNLCEECGGRKSGYGTAGKLHHQNLGALRRPMSDSLLIWTGLLFSEILRDYGFVEHFPQRWHYMEEDFQFDIDQIEDGKLIVTWDEDDRPTKLDGKLMEQCRVWFRWEIRRLKRIKNLDLYMLTKHGDHGIPENELETIIQFIDANVVAMTAALASLGPSPPPGTVTTTRADLHSIEDDDEYADEDDDEIEGTCKADEDFGGCMEPIDIAQIMKNSTHYDDLEWEFDDLDYQYPTCNNRHLMTFSDFADVEFLKTNYQDLNFMRKESTDDTCMDLDNIVQICSNYRPQYHEYSTHAAGRFVKDVKRVIFIGGGDSMLLHEALKYPDLELVVGLEIDQTVVRKSFKYFHTNPHFEDERVEWWFGDATKSLLLLPEDYWGSFDLVLVDLSETVMSFSVTTELDVFDALSLLLNPVGVMVKNEHYHEKFSALFDYSAELNYESPVICNQVMVFGSNNVDFFRDPVFDHGVETKLYESMHTPENRYDLMHGYRKNIAPKEKCNVAIPEESNTQGTAAGIIEIMNVENCSEDLDEKIVEIMKNSAVNEGFTVISDPVFDNEVGVVVLKEGFISARILPTMNYVGFDVNLWGMSSKIKKLRQALAESVGSSDVSSYKVVVGGMYGSSSWKEDQKIQGPKMKQLRNCEDDVVKEGILDEKTTSAIATEEIVPLTLNAGKGVTAAVFCGQEGEECVAYDVLEKHDSVKAIIPIYDCADAGKVECELEVLDSLAEQIFEKNNGKRINLLVMDGTSSFGMHQIVSSILGEIETRRSLFEVHNIVATWMEESVHETFRREFLDRYRKQVHFVPAARAEIVFKADSKTYELGIVSSNNENVNYDLKKMESRMKNRLLSFGVKVELRTVHGALFKFDPDWDPKTFRHEEYDSKPGREQFKHQTPLGRQNIYQFVKATNIEEGLNLDMTKITSYLSESLKSVSTEPTLIKQFEDIGDGGMILAISEKGYVTVVWDGREHITVNFFTRTEDIGSPEKFAGSFLNASGQKLQVGLRDDQPRGINRVINFPSDMDPTRKPKTQPKKKMPHYQHFPEQ